MPKILDVSFFIVFALCVFGLWRQRKNAGHLTTLAWVFVATTSVSWMEAPWDWILYVRYNPEVLVLMPSDLPVLGVADGLPRAIFYIFGIWFTLPSYLVAVWAIRKNWSTVKTFVGGWILCGVYETIMEYLFIKTNIHAYTNVIPNLAIAEGTAHQYPLDVPLLIGPFMAFYAVVLVRSQRSSEDVKVSSDRSFIKKIQGLRAFGGIDDRFSINLLGSVVIAHIIFFVPMIPELIVRYAQWRSVVGDPTPFGHIPWPW